MGLDSLELPFELVLLLLLLLLLLLSDVNIALVSSSVATSILRVER